MSTSRPAALLLAFSGLFLAFSTRAQQPATATAPASQPLTAVITGVEGAVQVREGGDAPWQKAVAGMPVTEGAEFRTGPKSAVRVFLPPDQTITLDRLGTMKLLTAIQTGTVVKTKVAMPYG